MGSYKDLPLWGQFTIMGVIAVVILFAGYKWIPNIEEQRNTIERLRVELADLKEEVRKGKILAAKEPQLRREIAELQLRLEELKAIIPPVRDDAQLTEKLKTLADRSTLDINKVKYKSLKDEEFYRSYPIDMDIDGTYHDLATFFDRLSRESRIFNVGGLKIKAQRKSSRHSIQATFTATTFVFKEEDETTNQAGGQKGGRNARRGGRS